MLERITIAPEQVDLGALAEAMVYYGAVDVAYQSMHIVELVKRLGIETVLRLAESGTVRFVYEYGVSAVMTDDSSVYPHAFFTVRLHGTADGRPIRNAGGEIAEAFRTHIGPGVIAQRDVRRLVDAIYVRSRTPPAVGKFAIQDIQDYEYLTQVFQIVLRKQMPSYPRISSVFARGHANGDNFFIETNLDYNLANAIFRQTRGNEESTVGSAHFAAPVIGVRDQMYYCGGEASDLWMSDLRSALLRARVNSFATRTEGSRNNIDRFQEVIFAGRSFSEAIERGERSILEILDFCQSADTLKFKEWLRSCPPDGDLLAEYERSKIQPSKLMNSLPYKMTKLVLFSAAGIGLEKAIGGAGALGATLGSLASNIVTGSADEWLASKLKLGWKPNQWVAGSAAPFVRGSGSTSR